MCEDYLTDKNIKSKADRWISNLNISGSRLENFFLNPKKSALLVVDMQNFFLNKKSHAFIPAAITISSNINMLIKEFRKKNFPIIYTYHAYKKNEDPGIMDKWWGDVLRIDNPLSKIHKSIDWNKSDITLRKIRYSAFIGTDLDNLLKKLNLDTLVITGVMTHLCCETTARDAFMKDYNVYFVVDATATDKESLHISSLNTLSDGFAIPIKTESILEVIKNLE